MKPFHNDKVRKVRFFFLSSIILLVLLTISLMTTAQSVAFAHSAYTAKVQVRSNSSEHQQFGTSSNSVAIDTLSSELSSYLSTLGPKVGVEVYDVTQQRYYTYNNTVQFMTASSIKVPIMLAFFAMTESQGREPDAQEMDLLTAMIGHSDNDATDALYSKINGSAGLASYLQQIGLSGLELNTDAWGYSLITPQTMVNLLTKLYTGTILTANDRATALHLMQNVEVNQRWGIGDIAPGGASVAMKNGWVSGPDGLWSVNTSGIVDMGGRVLLVSVYTQQQQAFADGQAIVQHVCGGITSLLS